MSFTVAAERVPVEGRSSGFTLWLRWLVVKIMVPFWVPIIIRPLIFRVPKKGP